MTEVIEPGAELEPVPTNSLFRTDDPVQVIQKASEVATALADVIAKRKLFVKIQGKTHVTLEGWQTLGAMLGVTPVCEWSRPVDPTNVRAEGWEARVLAQTLDGRVIGAAESQCLRDEKRWKTADDYAVRSMAQTRAASKALASVLRFVVTLVGYEGTPAEEMPTTVESVQADPEVQAAQAKVLKAYESLTPEQRKGLTKAKLTAQMKAATDTGELDRLEREVKERAS